MRIKALSDERYELIKSHILDPENSPLPQEMQQQLDRIISMAKVLDKHPTLKHAVALHRSKYPGISNSQAYLDGRIARRIYKSMHEFDFDFWKSWLVNDIVENINRCEDNPSHQSRRIIAMEHANLIKAIGEKPDDLQDPRRNEKHQFYLLVQLNQQNIKIDLNSLEKLPAETLKKLNRALAAGSEINLDRAQTIMES
jgi:hypothetical protein